MDDGPVGTADPSQRIKRLDGGGHVFTSADGEIWKLLPQKYDTIREFRLIRCGSDPQVSLSPR